MSRLSKKGYILIFVWLGMVGGTAELAVLPTTAWAGSVVNFRDDTVDPPLCYPFSLNEQVVAESVNNPKGAVGPGCPFDVTIGAAGEWVLTGGYFDTPPYGWGRDAYYDAGVGSFSFSCSNPQYSFDQGALPSYVELERVEDIAGSGGQAPGKHYFFQMGPTAPTTGSFNLYFSFQASCQMKKSGSGTLSPVAPGTRCSDLGEITINPRQGNLRLPVTIDGSCLPPTPTPTPRPTATPTLTPTPRPTVPPVPTNTPRPTITRPPGNGNGNGVYPTATPTGMPTGTPGPTATLPPGVTPSPTPTSPPGVTPTATPTLPPWVTPTATPTLPPGVTPTATPTLPPGVTPTATPTLPPWITPSPTPTPEASCDCSSMQADHTDLSNVKRGDVLNFTTEAYTPTPNTAKVLNMKYTIWHVRPQDQTVISKVAESGMVEAVDIGGGRYKTQWSYRVKDSDPEGLYRAEAKINCGWKASNAFLLKGENVKRSSVGKNIYDSGEVAGAAEEGEGFFLFRLLRNVLNILFGTAEDGTRTAADVLFPTTVKPTGTSLQLGTFYPLPEGECTEVYYRVGGE